ncbi:MULTISPECIES: hypothetical protein [Methylobacterium]|uniref:Uncharacterized protein n=1 Tax=Methylobacterium jeotgali TaxID=381630 RepID=A0ABQ4SVI3_9HYPH|nr:MULTISPECIES: hypothetical protein [Methylobacterium]PIU05776.1 MAG: hypothetical protein COT56_13470 [Methylobacterium sp. CG09_land_8_20_14_0_10_71_15]PIU15317.1 MAG: hypothetical protein COT28_05180 [Methylobacterium sp. CG08_land_8_20_14_0_20_71_15]GBU18871.1 hypothetical protein AwMethylo_30860 [Methylobacterium sp.]GJE06478.1 hypothetical protein AOPFMNJM_1798 [Methylobacterium jeotgali]
MSRAPLLSCLATGLAAGLALGLATPASALSAQDCSAKYQAAKKADTLKGQSWNDFRKAQCGDAAAAEPAAAPAAKAAAPATPSTTPAVAGSAVYPKAVDPKYAKESAGKGRQKTCLDQYNANKAAGGSANGGMNWIQKGGGYYAECNKRLKV